MPCKCCWRSLQNHLNACDGCGTELGAMGQGVWLTASSETRGCMASRAKALWCHQLRALVHLLAHFWAPVCGNWAQCCCTEGKSLEQIQQPDPS